MEELRFTTDSLTKTGFIVAKGWEVLGVARINDRVSFTLSCSPSEATQLFATEDFALVSRYAHIARELWKQALAVRGRVAQ